MRSVIGKSEVYRMAERRGRKIVSMEFPEIPRGYRVPVAVLSVMIAAVVVILGYRDTPFFRPDSASDIPAAPVSSESELPSEIEVDASVPEEGVIETETVPEKKVPIAPPSIPATRKAYGIIFRPPHQYKTDRLGRMVCIHDDDKPGASKRDKPIHKDMECCLDQDEIPNPYCHYPREKYGKLLDDFVRKQEKMLRRYRQGKGL